MSQTPNILQAAAQPVITTQDIVNKVAELLGRPLSAAETGIVEFVMLAQHAMQIVAQEKQMASVIMQKK